MEGNTTTITSSQAIAITANTAKPDLTIQGAGTVHPDNYINSNTTYIVEDGGLSENNLTNVLKGEYDSAYTHSQSSHAPINAEANVQSNWLQTDSTLDDFILGKPVTITSQQASDILTNNNKVGITYGQAMAIQANSNKVSFPGFGESPNNLCW